ncbi:MAG TPA: PKD domain-containing protein [Candidatus Competibacter sp.]|nr:PKD domain-containing protein [Candidatus Competibacter sp.]
MSVTASTRLNAIWCLLGWTSVFLLSFSTTNVFAAQATLNWNTVAGASGYRLYQVQTNELVVDPTTRHVTDASPVVADVATNTATLNLLDGKTYYFAIKAYNNTGISALSNEVGKTLPMPAPSVNFSADKTSGPAPLAVNFTDGSTNATTWSWNFGDNTTGTAQHPVKTYSSAGTYTVTLKATGPGGSTTATKTNYITANAPSVTVPTASFSAMPVSGTAPLLVTFSDTSSGTATNRSWDFGNGQTSTAQNASITYNTAGTYTVKLTVGNTGGSTTATKTISAAAAAPTANFSASSTAGTVPLTVTFANTSTGTVTDYAWNFGDGNTVATQTKTNPTHTYASAGRYTVSLTAKGPAGTHTKTQPDYIAASAASASAGGLVAAYNFEEASGETVVDVAGKGNHGTIKEAARSVSGKFGRALSFDGVNDWVTVNDSNSLDLTQGMTLAAWVYPTAALSGWRSVLLKERTGGLTYALYANSDSNQPAASLNIGSDQNLPGGSQLTVNAWVYLAATYDGVTERLYVNGNQMASKAQTGNMTVSNGTLRIGGNSVWNEFFKGRIDEIRVYNRALSATELKADMNMPIATSSPPSRLLGDQQIGTKTDTISKGTAKAFLKQADKTGRVASLSVYVASGSTALVAGLYTNNNGRPGSLLGQGTLSAPKAGSWNTVDLPATAVAAGTTYWIAILSPGGSLQVSDQVGGGKHTSETSPYYTSSTLPSAWWSTGVTPSSDGPVAGYGAGY